MTFYFSTESKESHGFRLVWCIT